MQIRQLDQTLCPADMNSFGISDIYPYRHSVTPPDPPDKVFGHPKTIPKTPSLGGRRYFDVQGMYVYYTRIIVRTIKFGQGTYVAKTLHVRDVPTTWRPSIRPKVPQGFFHLKHRVISQKMMRIVSKRPN